MFWGAWALRVSGSGKCSRKDFELRGLKFALLFNLYNRKLKPQLKHLKPRKTRPHDLPMMPRHSTHVDSQTSPMNWQMGISETPCSDTYVALPDILQTLLLHLVLHQNPILKKLVALPSHLINAAFYTAKIQTPSLAKRPALVEPKRRHDKEGLQAAPARGYRKLVGV